jgi:hypothetical protein
MRFALGKKKEEKNGKEKNHRFKERFFTVHCSLFTVFVLLFALSSPLVAEAADKLVVKDSEGEIKFVVTDEGKVCIGNTVPVQ